LCSPFSPPSIRRSPPCLFTCKSQIRRTLKAICASAALSSSQSVSPNFLPIRKRHWECTRAPAFFRRKPFFFSSFSRNASFWSFFFSLLRVSVFVSFSCHKTNKKKYRPNRFLPLSSLALSNSPLSRRVFDLSFYRSVLPFFSKIQGSFFLAARNRRKSVGLWFQSNDALSCSFCLFDLTIFALGPLSDFRCLFLFFPDRDSEKTVPGQKIRIVTFSPPPSLMPHSDFFFK